MSADLTIYKVNLKNMSDKDFAEEYNRISAIMKGIDAYFTYGRMD